MGRRWTSLIGLLAACLLACAGAVQQAGSDATKGAVDQVVADTPHLADAGATITSAAASAAVQQLTGPQAQAGVKQLVDTGKSELLNNDTHDYLVGLAADMADAAVSRLNNAVQQDALVVKTEADSDLPKLERAAYIAIGVMAGAIVLVLLVMTLLIHETRKSRRSK